MRWLSLIVLAAAASGEEWSRFRGPNGTGVAETAGLPLEFGPARNLVWKVPLPPGHSSPVLAGDRIFVTAFEGEKLLTVCLDRATGRRLWSRESPRTRNEHLDKRNSPASPSPVTDGKSVFVFFPDYGLMAYGLDGNELWRRPLGPFDNLYGMGASPVLADGRLVLLCDQSRGSFIAAFSLENGRELWRTARPQALSGHSTPIVQRAANGRVQIVAPGSFLMDAYDAATGKSAWSISGMPPELKSVPVLADGVIYINGFGLPQNDPGQHPKIPPFEEVLAKHDRNKDGRIAEDEGPAAWKTYFPYMDLNHDKNIDAHEWHVYELMMTADNGLLAVRTDGTLLWKYHKAIPQLPSTLVYQGVLYMISDAGVLTTINPATGDVWKQSRLRGAADNYYASPVAADGKVFFVSLSGVVTVVKPGPDAEVLAVNELEEECYATPAISGGRIYIRTRGALYCFGKP